MKNQILAHALSVHQPMGYLGGAQEQYVTHPLIREVEPTIHEICHGVSLGLRIDAKIPDRVTDYFEELNTRSPALGLAAEAHVLAIERHVLHRLGWLRYVRYTGFMKSIYKTGYSGQALPFKTFLTIYRRLLRERAIQERVNTVIQELHRLTKIPFESS